VTAPLPEDFIQLCNQLGLNADRPEVEGGVVVNGECAPYDLMDYESWLAGTSWAGGARDGEDRTGSDPVDMEVQQQQ